MKWLFIEHRVSTKQLVIFTRQLATLMGAGLPLLKSLRTLQDQLETSYFKEAIGEIAREIEAGTSFSSSLQQYPNIFPEIFVNMIKAGEIGGMLDEILKRLAEFLEKAQRLRERVRSALVYPAFVLLIALLILILLMIFVVPTFTNMFAELGGSLPIPTKILIGISDAIRYKWYYIVIVMSGLILAYTLIARSPKGRLLIDALKLKLPIIGDIFQKVAVARFSRILGTLINSGVPILGALKTTKDTVGNQVISNALSKVHDSIKEGESVAQPLEASQAFPPLIVKMVAIGEETGQLDKMLVKIAQTYEEEVDLAISALTSLLEPLLIVVMGVVVGFIVISMFMPLFTLAKLIE